MKRGSSRQETGNLATALSCAALLSGILLACGGTTPTVKTRVRSAPEARPLRVPHPPPPAKIEVIPIRRNKECRYLDGYWDYRDDAWHWIKGAWVRPPDDCLYSPPRTRFEQSRAGTVLLYRPGEWYHLGQEGMCDDAVPCEASTTPADGE